MGLVELDKFDPNELYAALPTKLCTHRLVTVLEVRFNSQFRHFVLSSQMPFFFDNELEQDFFDTRFYQSNRYHYPALDAWIVATRAQLFDTFFAGLEPPFVYVDLHDVKRISKKFARALVHGCLCKNVRAPFEIYLERSARVQKYRALTGSTLDMLHGREVSFAHEQVCFCAHVTLDVFYIVNTDISVYAFIPARHLALLCEQPCPCTFEGKSITAHRYNYAELYKQIGKWYGTKKLCAHFDQYKVLPGTYVDLHDARSIIQEKRYTLHGCPALTDKLEEILARTKPVFNQLTSDVDEAHKKRVLAQQHTIAWNLAMREYMTNPHNCEAAIDAWVAQWRAPGIIDLTRDSSEEEEPPKKRARDEFYENDFDMACIELGWSRLQEECARVSQTRAFRRAARAALMEKCKSAAERVYEQIKQE